MAMFAVPGAALAAIATAIRGKTGKTEQMTVEEMAPEIDSIPSGGGVQGMEYLGTAETVLEGGTAYIDFSNSTSDGVSPLPGMLLLVAAQPMPNQQHVVWVLMGSSRIVTHYTEAHKTSAGGFSGGGSNVSNAVWDESSSRMKISKPASYTAGNVYYVYRITTGLEAVSAATQQLFADFVEAE